LQPWAFELFFEGWMRGFEPPTTGSTIQCSNQLSYIHHVENKV
jgi:hypothetical protein